MRRRDFITLLGGAAAAWPLAARAQQRRTPVIGFLHPEALETSTAVVAGFRKGLAEVGYVEGRNLTIEFRWAQYDSARLSELAIDLVNRQVAAIATPGSTAAALAAKAATTTIPIVFGFNGDPVRLGLVASLNRPGGNITGFTGINIELGSKKLGLLHELLPQATRIAVLVDPGGPTTEAVVRDARTAASALGQKIIVLHASNSHDIDAAFETLVKERAEALLISPGNLFNARRLQIALLAVRHAVPTIYGTREFVESGGLMSYGTSNADQYRQVGIYAGRILKGEKPADMPVLQPVKFEFFINLQTARILGLQIPPTLLAIADEVLE